MNALFLTLLLTASVSLPVFLSLISWELSHSDNQPPPGTVLESGTSPRVQRSPDSQTDLICGQTERSGSTF
ncbi:hypothetical protein PBY51_016570 [Eleginops maclovinus]|uniref:Uncharacterized protein n=1 Tax=Eleginops maclovinus TaxID=56733 RepID=A0AAN7WPW7_ELEMC|nr:hypothetical protein PBY51_016570 [Eleginops maclovinus]